MALYIIAYAVAEGEGTWASGFGESRGHGCVQTWVGLGVCDHTQRTVKEEWTILYSPEGVQAVALPHS